MRTFFRRFIHRNLNGIKVLNDAQLFTVIDAKVRIPGGRLLKLGVKVDIHVEECRNWWNPTSFYRMHISVGLNNSSKKAIARYPSLRTFKGFTAEEQQVLSERNKEEALQRISQDACNRYTATLERLMHNKERVPYFTEPGGMISACVAAGEMPPPKKMVNHSNVVNA